MTSNNSQHSEHSFSEYFDNDEDFLEALSTSVLPGDLPSIQIRTSNGKGEGEGQDASGMPNLKRPRSSSPSPSLEDVKPGIHTSSSRSTRSASAFDALTVGARPKAGDDTYDPARFGQFGEYMRRKRAKLQIQNFELDDGGSEEGTAGTVQAWSKNTKIFKGVAIYINGETRPSIQELRKLIMEYGGIFHAYLDRKSLVTHVITMSLTPAKIREFKNMKIVTPAWIVDSIAADTLLPWRDYIFRPGDRAEDTQGMTAPQKSLLSTFKTRTQGQTSRNGTLVKRAEATPSLQPTSMELQKTAIGADTVEAAAADIPSSSALTPPSNQLAVRPRTPPHPHTVYTTDPADPKTAARVPGYAPFQSNPHAERVMKSAEWRAAHTSVAGAEFIEGFYRNSRLHHLSTWKSELKSLVAEAQEKAEKAFEDGGGGVFDDVELDGGDEFVSSEPQPRHDNAPKSREKGASDAATTMRGTELLLRSPPKNRFKGKGKADSPLDRVIMHVDFDSFFVSVGLITRPELKGKPVVVCHSQGGQGGAASTSEIASASYAARDFGVKNGMSLRQARTLCPSVMTIPYEFERYKEISLQFYTILMAHADDLQAVSVDEALIDVTSSVARMKESSTMMDVDVFSDRTSSPAKELAELIRSKIRRVTQCEASIGISHNIMLARLATRRAKPASSYHLLLSEVSTFIAPLHIDDLHGFGYATRDKVMEKFGTSVLGDLVQKSKGALCEALGRGTGETLYNAMRGVDERRLESDKARKSVSCEINYGIRFENNEQAEKFIYQLAEEVARRLKTIEMRGRSLTLKIMKRSAEAPLEPPKFLGHGLCDVFNKQVTISGGRATNDPQVIGADAWRLLKGFAFDPAELRGVGMQIQKLDPVSESSTDLGQARLNFLPKDAAPPPHPKIAESSKAAEARARAQAQQDPHQQVHPAIIVIESSSQEEPPAPPAPGPAPVKLPKRAVSSELDLPSLSQVDKSVLDALPADIKKELEMEYKRRSASPLPPKPFSFGPAQPQKARIIVRGQKSNLSRITRQLAPRNAPSISPRKNKNKLFAQREKPVNVTKAELKRLKIDPEVFSALPIELQREQLAGARYAKSFGTADISVNAPRKIIRARNPNAPVKRIPRKPNPNARYTIPPSIKLMGMKVHITEAEDVQDSIEAWLRSSDDSPPAPEDVDYFADFMLQCIEGQKGSDMGVEKVTAVMQWWLILLRRRWRIWERRIRGSDSDETNDDWDFDPEAGPARAWWRAFRDVKSRLDAAVRKRFGGSIRIR